MILYQLGEIRPQVVILGARLKDGAKCWLRVELGDVFMCTPPVVSCIGAALLF